MFVSHLRLQNWRNFLVVDTKLTERVFLVGPNACGKSNFLDVFRFLRDITSPGGGLQKAANDRGGLSKIRCLAARGDPYVLIDIELRPTAPNERRWRYSLKIGREPRGFRRTIVKEERVWKDGKLIDDRPDSNDIKDVERLIQTHLEQINSNQAFRPIARYLESVSYLHLVPQLVRNPEAFAGPGIQSGDPFGRNFLERVARTPKATRLSRLRKIEHALQITVPQLRNLSDVIDESGIPHLEAVYEHWRPHAGKQREDQFSDGTLRLMGLLWALLESDPLLLLEEPELSLNAGVVKHLPSLMYRLQKQQKKQIMLSTHSCDLLTDPGIGPEEVLVMSPNEEGTQVTQASSIREINDLLQGGLTIADAVQPRMVPKNVRQLQLFQ